MPGTLVIGYGGYGCSCARTYAELHGRPVLLMDYRSFSEDEYTLTQDCIELTEDTNLNASRIRNVMEGYRSVLLLSPIGGGSFETAHSLISECARSLDLPMISLCTIPYSFESERRSKALESLASLPESVDNVFVIDLQRTISSDAATENFQDYLERTGIIVADLMKILSDMMDTIPFSSYCSSPVYTISIGSGIPLAEAVSDALAHPYFDIVPGCGKVLIFTESDVSQFDMEQAVSLLSAHSNALPEYVGRAAIGKNSVLLFIPISFRQTL